MDHKIINFWTNFGAIFGAILGPELAPKRDQKWDHFWNPLAPHLRGPNNAKTQNKRECCKSYWSWNSIPQKKGRDKAFEGPYKALKELYKAFKRPYKSLLEAL